MRVFKSTFPTPITRGKYSTENVRGNFKMIKKVKSLSRFIQSKEKIKKYDTVIINLSSSRRNYPDEIGGNPLCSHSQTKNQACTSCGAFVGYIGYEENPIKFYLHLNFIVNLFEAETVYVIHNKLHPLDFKQYSMITKSKIKYHRSVVFANGSIVNVYSKLPKKEKYSHINKTYFQFLISLRNIGSVFWVNPNNEEKQLRSDFMVFEEK